MPRFYGGYRTRQWQERVGAATSVAGAHPLKGASAALRRSIPGAERAIATGRAKRRPRGGSARDEPTPVSRWWLRFARTFARPAAVQSGVDDLPLPVDAVRGLSPFARLLRKGHAIGLVAHAKARLAARQDCGCRILRRFGVNCVGVYAATRLKRPGAPGLSTVFIWKKFGRTRLGGPAASRHLLLSSQCDARTH